MGQAMFNLTKWFLGAWLAVTVAVMIALLLVWALAPSWLVPALLVGGLIELHTVRLLARECAWQVRRVQQRRLR